MVERILAGSPHKTFRALTGNRFHSKRRGLGEADFRHSHLVFQELIELFGFGSTCLPLDSCIYILRIFTEHAHVHFFRCFHRRMNALIPTDRTQTNIQIQSLAQSHVQRTDSTADRGRQRPLDADQIFLESLHRFIRQPRTCLVESAFARQHFFPFNPTFAAVCFLNSRVHNGLHRRSHFRSYSVSGNIRYDRHIGHR